MGTVTGTTIINKAAIQLTDLSNIRWTRSELLLWLNDGQRTIILLDPNANNVTTTQIMAAGTRQTIPASGWMLLAVYRNMGTSGTTPGRTVRIVSKRLLDDFEPNWHSDTAVTEVQNYVYDIQDKTSFWVYPPSDGTGHIQLNYSQTPASLASEKATVSVNDIYETALTDYILFRACSKDAEYAPGAQLSQGYWASFSAAVSGKETAEEANTINNSIAPRSQSKPGDES